ncbi:PadR family transcriptional regulator [Acinetobacter sp. MD2(2019)]|uniref:PadR family transcriptional regulator n=1 Tax=Acinetobacter sp. MD2(2019) TaxID=2605273 RepID=UPI002D1F35AE|nr:PadR family transcriptional regulator [Acinetobacter sp. MD2(2019)]MEB3752971.1 PadR family transcriptional regulator [Acinetobacter sp. MD2(2019)]
MSLAHVLLTSLLEQPSTGFELARRFDHSMGYFWQASHQQIYRELSLMLKKSWISIHPESASSRSKTYQVEQQGRIELTQWLSQHSSPAQVREELMVRLRAEAQLGSNAIFPELKRHLAAHQKTLALYQNIFEKDFVTENDQDRTLFIHKMILELGMRIEQEWIDWLEAFIPALQQRSNVTEQ